MRFCLVSTQPNWGGGEALLWSIGQELQALGHEVAWIVRDTGGLKERIQGAQAQVLQCLTGRGRAPGQWLATVRALRAYSPDILIANDTHSVPLVGSAALFCRPKRPVRLAYKHTIFPLRSKLKYRWLSDKLVCVSQAARGVVLDGGVPAARTAVIYGGCIPPTHDPQARSWATHELGVGSDEKLLVCVGNLLSCKGHSVLIEAISQVVRVDPKIQLVIAGEGEERPRLTELIDRLQLQRHVRLLGYRKDADRLLDAADLVVHPSLSEGLSLVLIQAQMLGRPVVATAVGGTTEVLAAQAPELCTAWLAEAGNADSLAKRIREACEAIAADSGDFAARLETTASRTRETFGLRESVRQLVELASLSMR
jgi:glycosyltransferase involved in cell wall biosynthesis